MKGKGLLEAGRKGTHLKNAGRRKHGQDGKPHAGKLPAGAEVVSCLASPWTEPLEALRRSSGSFRTHIMCSFFNSAEGLQTMWEDHSAPHCRVRFQYEAWFHFLARYNSAFAIFVVLLWKIHGKANYCAGPVFSQTLNVSSGSEWGTTTVLPCVV